MSNITPTTPRSDKNKEDVTIFVKDMLDEMELEFAQAGNSILGRMDQMGKKLDDLEQSITDLMLDAGLDSASKQSTSSVSSQITPQSSPKKQPAVL